MDSLLVNIDAVRVRLRRADARHRGARVHGVVRRVRVLRRVPRPRSRSGASIIGTASDDRELLDLAASTGDAARRPRRDARGPRGHIATRCSQPRRCCPASTAWIDEADAAGLGLAIASSSPDDWVLGHLERLGLRGHFAHVDVRGRRAARQARARYLSRRVRGARRRSARARSPSRTRRTGSPPRRPRACCASWCRTSLTKSLDLSAADLRLDSLADCSLHDAIARITLDRTSAPDRPRASCPATGRAPTPSRPGRTASRATGARRRDRDGPRDSR